MTRARDIANLGTQAGSGLDASDITTGVLPVGVTGGTGLTALGTVTAGTIGSAVNLNHDAKKNSWHLYRSATVNYGSPDSVIDFDSNVFIGTNVTEAGGRITVTTAGLYLISCSINRSNTETATMDFELRVDGTVVNGTRIYTAGAAPPNYVGDSASWPVSLNASQVVDMFGNGHIYGSSTASMSSFTGTRIGAIS